MTNPCWLLAVGMGWQDAVPLAPNPPRGDCVHVRDNPARWQHLGRVPALSPSRALLLVHLRDGSWIQPLPAVGFGVLAVANANKPSWVFVIGSGISSERIGTSVCMYCCSPELGPGSLFGCNTVSR